MTLITVDKWKNISRHPRILYWFWDSEIFINERYLKDLQRISDETCYTVLAISSRSERNFFNRDIIPHFKKAVDFAHKLGLKVFLQVWPEECVNYYIKDISPENAVALVSESETDVKQGMTQISLFCKTDHARESQHMKSELLRVFAFHKIREDKYIPGSLVDITDRAICNEEDQGLSISLSVSDLEGYTIYAMATHYYYFADICADFLPKQYYSLLTDLKDVGFDSIVLDEFKNMLIKREGINFRDRLSGKSFSQGYTQRTCRDFAQTLFEMRYVEEGAKSVRINAINSYFEWLRKSINEVELLLYRYINEFYGEDAFLGVHNTFHNHLQNDEMWATGCNWWELPRKYAQTDEDIALPIRLGIACQCPEALHYDMFYSYDVEQFLCKCIEDARYGGRIHYHAMNDNEWGKDIAADDFIEKINEVEKKITLLDWFDGPMPKCDLLVVFGMPALSNWYPDIDARNSYDLNGSANIIERVEFLWSEGCRCVLAPSDAVDDGRIAVEKNGFSYCGHHFSSLLYLYPQYAKENNIAFLQDAIRYDLNVRIVGESGYTFKGEKLPLGTKKLFKGLSIDEDTNIVIEMNLPVETRRDRCELEDGSCVFSSYETLKSGVPTTFSYQINGTTFEGEYIGSAAIKSNDYGELERFVCGGFTRLLRNNEVCLEVESRSDVYWDKENGLQII